MRSGSYRASALSAASRNGRRLSLSAHPRRAVSSICTRFMTGHTRIKFSFFQLFVLFQFFPLSKKGSLLLFHYFLHVSNLEFVIVLWLTYVKFDWKYISTNSVRWKVHRVRWILFFSRFLLITPMSGSHCYLATIRVSYIVETTVQSGFIFQIMFWYV
jgi:hypothetical protein